jgi:hypothetical protein
MRVALLIAVALASTACDASTDAPQKVEQARPKPPDERRRFVAENRISMELVDDHILGKNFLPGGNVAEYELDGKRYQRFLVATKDPAAATFLTMDIKDALAGSKFVPQFGGYFGMDGDTPWFIFPKDKYVAGIVGLPEQEADSIAREFASRIY